jgi:hypothetical protein
VDDALTRLWRLATPPSGGAPLVTATFEPPIAGG